MNIKCVIINELSLDAQFTDSMDFWKNGMPPFYRAINDVKSYDMICVYKQSLLYNAQVTPDHNLYSLLKSKSIHFIDESRRYKSILSNAIIKGPFWDCEPQDSSDNHNYTINKKDVTGSSVAEAIKRSAYLLSFVKSMYEKNPIIVQVDGINTEVNNIYDEMQLHSILFENNELTLEQYIKIHFSSGKLDFTKIDNKNGFNLIDDTNKDEFINSFNKFNNLEWNKILTDNGLNYKDFHYNKKTKSYFSNEQWSIGIKNLI